VLARAYCADWGKETANREVCVADIQQRRVELVQGRAPWTVRSLISLAASNSAAGTAIVGYALLAAAALLRCVLAGTPLSKPALEDRVAEGAILGGGKPQPSPEGRSPRVRPARKPLEETEWAHSRPEDAVP
jgi:hypothetical protein